MNKAVNLMTDEPESNKSLRARLDRKLAELKEYHNNKAKRNGTDNCTGG